MQVSFDELPPAQYPVGARMSEHLVHAVVDPDGLIRLHVPFEDTERSPVGGDTQTRLTFAQRLLRAFAFGHVEVDAKNTVRANRGMGAEPTLGAIGHPQAEFVMIALRTALHGLFLGVAGLQ